uniref:Uncharacterized protein n=1 Tax=Lactuca sativa TaxID=4236 RepID=A0A9R1WFI1_LACSA|nr:hypothetical protein LSAT_V11C100030160 [Lactuca sativa]
MLVNTLSLEILMLFGRFMKGVEQIFFLGRRMILTTLLLIWVLWMCIWGRRFTWVEKQCLKWSSLIAFLFLVVHVVLKNDVIDYGPTLFKLFHSWFILDGFEDTVKDVWVNYSHEENINSFILFKNKLKSVKERLKIWHKQVVTSIFSGTRRVDA